jgi:hypothetical protein
MIYNVISYGAGTQSTALILMALNGEYNLPRPDFAVFSDTGGEPKFILEYFDYFQKYCKEKYDFDIYKTSKKGVLLVEKITSEQLKSRKGNFYTSSVPPFFTLNPDGTRGMLMRQCTGDYKTHPTNSFIKSKVNKGDKINLWLEISFDERSRMRISTVKWRINKYPLVDNFINRKMAIDYVRTLNIEMPQRSSCFFCPFHSDRYWKWLRDNHRDEFINAVELERKVQSLQNTNSILKSVPFLHRSCISLDKIDFDSDTQLDMFPELIDECEGYCGI